MTSRARRVAAMALVVAGSSVLAACGGVFAETSTDATSTLPTLPPTTTSTIPVTTTTAAPTEYEIMRGDTMRKIAAKFNTTVEAILAANPKIKDPNKIQAGQRIVIPAPAAAPAPAAPVPTSPPST